MPPPPQPGGVGVLGNRLTKDAENNSSGEQKQGDVAEEDAEVCFICASPIDHQSVAPCNHRTCHICALRLRALYKTKACAHCRTEAATVIFTDEGEKRYEEYTDADFFRTDANLGIAYEKPEIFEDTVLLLRYNCPDASCDAACMGWPDLHRHVRSAHHKVMCDLCTRNKKVFTHEHELFTKEELRKHEKHGDDMPGAENQSGFKGHPECGFCRQRFYGDDELYAHCRDRHERCHLCDRRTGGSNPAYFVDYAALEQHFNRDHYPCMDQECLEKKFVVFDSEMDLKAHQIEQHPNGLSKGRIDRRVDLSTFDYRPQYQEERSGRGGRGGRRAGRGRDPNADGPAPTSAGHMSRAEIAHQRAREIHSAQNVSNRTFGGSLTQPEPPTQTAHRPQHSPPQQQRAQPDFPSLGVDRTSAPSSTPASPRPAAAQTPQEQARALRHATVTERAANLLHNDKIKLDEFRERISAYNKNSITAGDLIDAFFALFDTSSQQLGKLIKELAEIFEAPAKRDGLLKAWADWKAINEDYPSLPGPAGVAPSTAAGVLGKGIGTNRVLKLKSSTAQSGRSVTNATPKTWGPAAGLQASSSRAAMGFPSLPSSSANGTKSQPAGWLALRPAASSAGSSAASSAAPSRTQSSANISLGKARGGASGDAFPALPAAKKPTSTVFSPGYTGSGVIRTNSGTPVSAWAGGSTNGNGSGVATPSVEPEVLGKGKGKKGKQVLFQWG
ncbi:zinc finger protein [Teratosphaeria destructans]|uniref:RING-type E3 ubiquitin transferase n=1 Tax=Teratosphaeria destructans TaxID=418781 RepID=A0A9W7SZJ4_9PEZI|nr:zinc finger protein [Teratosphaeria destructans]